MELPKLLKANRERLGMSQEEVAHAVYVSRQTMSSWENGKTYPDVQSLLLLSNLFSVSVDELLKGDVIAMKDMISKDAMRMERLAWAAILLMLMGVGCMVGLNAVWHEPSFIPYMATGTLAGIGAFLVLWALAMMCAVRIERIKRDHNLVTYEEISAFMDGEDVPNDDKGLSRKNPLLANTVKLLCGAFVGLVISFIVVIVVNAIY